jgi:ankyrin repeat protein/WD40 repeat protein
MTVGTDLMVAACNAITGEKIAVPRLKLGELTRTWIPTKGDMFTRVERGPHWKNDQDGVSGRAGSVGHIVGFLDADNNEVGRCENIGKFTKSSISVIWDTRAGSDVGEITRGEPNFIWDNRVQARGKRVQAARKKAGEQAKTALGDYNAKMLNMFDFKAGGSATLTAGEDNTVAFTYPSEATLDHYDDGGPWMGICSHGTTARIGDTWYGCNTTRAGGFTWVADRIPPPGKYTAVMMPQDRTSGPHSLEDFQRWWIEAGCGEDGTAYPSASEERASCITWWNERTVDEVKADMSAYRTYADGGDADYATKAGTATLIAPSLRLNDVLGTLELTVLPRLEQKDDCGEPKLYKAVEGVRIYESKHNYDDDMNKETPIEFKGASAIAIVFDPLCCTEDGADYLRFRRKAGSDENPWCKNMYMGAQGAGNWPTEPIFVEADNFVAFFHSDYSYNDWGYRFACVPVRLSDVEEDADTRDDDYIRRLRAYVKTGPDVDVDEGEDKGEEERRKSDATFEWLDANKSGQLELAEAWQLMALTVDMELEEIKEQLTKEVFETEVMGGMGGGTSIDADQFYEHVYRKEGSVLYAKMQRAKGILEPLGKAHHYNDTEGLFEVQKLDLWEEIQCGHLEAGNDLVDGEEMTIEEAIKRSAGNDAIGFCWHGSKSPEGDVTVSIKNNSCSKDARLPEVSMFSNVHPWCGVFSVGQDYIASGAVEVGSATGWSCQLSAGATQRGFVTVNVPSAPMTSGKWYYEWECVVEDFYHQIGWCKMDGSFAPNSDSGVGDDSNSWGCDLGRKQKWHEGSCESFGDSWENGATVGCAVDLDAGTMSFSKNGSWDGPWGEAFTGVDAGEGGLVPAASFGGRFVANFRLSADDFKHAPPSPDYKAVSEAGSLAVSCADAHVGWWSYVKKTLSESEELCLHEAQSVTVNGVSRRGKVVESLHPYNGNTRATKTVAFDTGDKLVKRVAICFDRKSATEGCPYDFMQFFPTPAAAAAAGLEEKGQEGQETKFGNGGPGNKWRMCDSSSGVAFRRSKDLTNRHPSGAVQYNEVVEATDDGNGWLTVSNVDIYPYQCSDLFLPIVIEDYGTQFERVANGAPPDPFFTPLPSFIASSPFARLPPNVDSQGRFGGYASEQNWPSEHLIIIEADKFDVHFESDYGDGDWGFRFAALPIFEEAPKINTKKQLAILTARAEAAEKVKSAVTDQQRINIKVVSSTRAQPSCNAEIWVDDKQVNKDTKNTDGNERGHHVAIIDVTGKVVDVKCFDTCGSPDSGMEMKNFLNGVADGHIVAFAINESGDKYVENTMSIFRALGCKNKPKVNVAQACVGQKGCGVAGWWRFEEGTGKEVEFTTEALPSVEGVRIYESKHNYDDNMEEETGIEFEGADAVAIMFDPTCCTEHGADFLRFRREEGSDENPWCKDMYTGAKGPENWPDEPIFVDAAKFVAYFHSDYSDNYWGYRFACAPVVFPVKEALYDPVEEKAEKDLIAVLQTNLEKMLLIGKPTIDAVAFSPDQTQIATGNLDGTVSVWDVATGSELVDRQLFHLYDSTSSNQVESFGGIAFSSDGAKIVMANSEHDVMAVCTVDGWGTSGTTTKERGKRSESEGMVRGESNPNVSVAACHFFPDLNDKSKETFMVIVANNATVKMFDETLKIRIASFMVHGLDPQIYALDFSHDGKEILIGSNLGTDIYERPEAYVDERGEVVFAETCIAVVPRMEHHGDEAVKAVAFSHGGFIGRRVVTGCADGTMAIISTTTRNEAVRVLREDRSHPITAVAFSSDGRQVIMEYGGCIYRYDSQTGKEEGDDKAKSKYWTPRGSALSLQLSDEDKTQLKWRGVSLDSRYTVEVTDDGKAIIRDARTEETVVDKEIHTPEKEDAFGPVSLNLNAVAFSPNSRLVAIAGQNGTLTVWDFITDKGMDEQTRNTDEKGDENEDGRIISRGEWVFQSRRPISVEIPKIKNLEKQEVFNKRKSTATRDATAEREKRVLRCVAFSPDGTRIACGGDDNTVRIHDAKTGKVIIRGSWEAGMMNTKSEASRNNGGRLTNGSVTAVEFSPDGRQIAFSRFCPGKKDGKLDCPERSTEIVVLCDAKTLRALIKPLIRNPDPNQKLGKPPARSIAFSPDGQQLVTGGSDGKVTIVNIFWRSAESVLACGDNTCALTLDDFAAVLAVPLKYESPCPTLHLADKFSSTPMHIAARNHNAKAIEVLIGAGVVATRPNDINQTILHVAAFSAGNDKGVHQPAIRMVTVLHEHLNDAYVDFVNQKDDKGRTALAFAVNQKAENVELVKFLLKHSADPNIADSFGRTPLHFACCRAFFLCANELIDTGADVNAVDDNHFTPLLLSALQGNEKMVTSLLARGACHIVKSPADSQPSLGTAPFEGTQDFVLGPWSGLYQTPLGGESWEAEIRVKFDAVPAVGDSIVIHYVHHDGAQGNYETAEVKEASFSDGKLTVVLEGVSVTGEDLCVTQGNRTFEITNDSFKFVAGAVTVNMTTPGWLGTAGWLPLSFFMNEKNKDWKIEPLEDDDESKSNSPNGSSRLRRSSSVAKVGAKEKSSAAKKKSMSFKSAARRVSTMLSIVDTMRAVAAASAIADAAKTAEPVKMARSLRRDATKKMTENVNLMRMAVNLYIDKMDETYFDTKGSKRNKVKKRSNEWVRKQIHALRADATGSEMLREAAERRDASVFEEFMKMGLQAIDVKEGGEASRGGLLHAVAAPKEEAANRANQGNAVKIVEILAAHWADGAAISEKKGEEERFERFAGLLNRTDHEGRTALSLAIDQDIEQAALVDCLLENTADPLIADHKQRTGLHIACVRGHVRCAKSLIENFVDVDAQDNMGRSALLISSIQGSVPLVFLLLQNGARHDLSDNNGMLALSYSLMPLTSTSVATQELRDKAKGYADMSETYDKYTKDTDRHPLAEGRKAGAAELAANGDTGKAARAAAVCTKNAGGSVLAQGAAAGSVLSDAEGCYNDTHKDAPKGLKMFVYDSLCDSTSTYAAAVELHKRYKLDVVLRKEGIKNDTIIQSPQPEGIKNDARYETIAMALLKKENHIDAAIDDDIPLFEEALERHFRDERPDLVKAYYDPTDSYDNDMFRDPLLQRAIDLDWTAKVFPSAAWDLVKFSFFLTIICLVGAVEAGQLTPSPHFLDQVFDTIFIGENWDDYGVKEFGDIGNAGELWPWIENVFLGGVYPDPEVWRDANGTMQASPVAANEFVGRPRMRTLESPPQTCEYHDAMDSSVQCFAFDLDEAPAWVSVSNNKTHADGFRWQAPGSKDGVNPIRGVFHTYPNGGLVVTMPTEKADGEALVAKLKAGDWINLNTRAFIAEFTAYNANKGMYTVGYIMIEMSRDGVYLPTFQFRNFPRVSYLFSSQSDILRLVLEVVFLIYFFVVYLRSECKQAGETWEDPVRKDAAHWKLNRDDIAFFEGNKEGGEKYKKRLENARTSLEESLKSTKPNIGSILVGNLTFEKRWAQKIVKWVERAGGNVVVRPYFYEAFNYFDIFLILCFLAAIAIQIAQVIAEMTTLPKICAGENFVPGSFIISQMHTTRMYLIAVGSFFCWCKVRKREYSCVVFVVVWFIVSFHHQPAPIFTHFFSSTTAASTHTPLSRTYTHHLM